MVTEYMLGGSLGDLLETNPHHAAWNRYGKQILLDVAEALNYLHSREPRVLHSDLKPDNVLLTGRVAYLIPVYYGVTLITIFRYL